MNELLRRGALALAACAALLTLTAAPALAQALEAEELYLRGPVGGVAASSGQRAVVVPTDAVQGPVGGVAASSGQRAVLIPSGAVQGQGLSLQVSGGGVAAAQQARVGGLAFTGGDITTMVLIGLSAMAAGLILTRRARPRTSSTELI